MEPDAWVHLHDAPVDSSADTDASADAQLVHAPAAAPVPDSAEEVDFAEFAQAVADNKTGGAAQAEPLDSGIGFVGVEDVIELCRMQEQVTEPEGQAHQAHIEFAIAGVGARIVPQRHDCLYAALAYAGSSSTVGFLTLSELARALEHALVHVQYASNPECRFGTCNVLQAAGSEVRKLLHQVAAGFVKSANEDACCQICRHELPQLDIDTSLHPPYERVDTGIFAQPANEHASMVMQEDAGAPPAPLAVNAGADHRADAADVVDVIDPDLFLFFEEEAQDLLPKLGMVLREWSAEPNHLPPRGEVLRHLHTLKGSAAAGGCHAFGRNVPPQWNPSSRGKRRYWPTVRCRSKGRSQPIIGARGDRVATSSLVPQSAFDVPVARMPMLMPIPMRPQAPSGVRHKPLVLRMAPVRVAAGQSVRVRSQLLDRLVNEAGEVLIARSRLDMRLSSIRASIKDMSANLERLRTLLRDVEVQAESQMQSRMAQAKDTDSGFDPLEFDRFTRVQELTRMMAESVNDVGTVQRNLQRTAEGAEDDLVAQSRQARELQRDLLRTRMVEFDSISERLYATVRQASKELGKQVKLDITGGTIEVDRGVLDRVTPAFEHLLRNSVAHGIETPEQRKRQNKPASGSMRSRSSKKATTSPSSSKTMARACTWSAYARRRCSLA
ncbi:hypothetical protein FQA39_LY18983 [Lamprigera yunnana]|nr:hypothetical protein FQA39_LY18983 [Lamprigera yunnana]